MKTFEQNFKIDFAKRLVGSNATLALSSYLVRITQLIFLFLNVKKAGKRTTKYIVKQQQCGKRSIHTCFSISRLFLIENRDQVKKGHRIQVTAFSYLMSSLGETTCRLVVIHLKTIDQSSATLYSTAYNRTPEDMSIKKPVL